MSRTGAAMGAKVLCRRLQTCRLARSVSVGGERRGAGVASGHKGLYGVCVCMDDFRQRQSLSASNGLSS